MSVISLPAEATLTGELGSRLAEDFSRYCARPLGKDLHDWTLERWKVDLTARYAGRLVQSPFGKASGQLSMTTGQVQADARAGLGFVVLKTVIAEDEQGRRAMEAWAVPESQMRVERTTDEMGESGWTVTWRGRGWDRSFDEYLRFFAESLQIGESQGIIVAPSATFHLPSSADEAFRVDEYVHTTSALLEVWRAAGRKDRMPLEKDFSPTLAGDSRSDREETVLRWLREVPALIGAAGRDAVDVGIKLMNAGFDDDFQRQMLVEVQRSSRPPSFIVAFNRLFDRARGVAYGGPALGRRNLRILELHESRGGPALNALSATGDIHSGRRMVEYALCGAESGQLHTFFQLPRSEYASSSPSRSAAALHELTLHPRTGLVAWMLYLRELGHLEPREDVIHFLDIASRAAPAAADRARR